MLKKIFFVILSFCLFQSVQAKEIIYVGDSLAVAMRQSNPNNEVVRYLNSEEEVAVSGKNPKWIYERLINTLSFYPNLFKGKLVILSSGYSNDPDGKFIDYHEKIIKTLLQAGAEIRMLGLANNFYINNKWGTHYYDEYRYLFLKFLANKYNLFIYPEFEGYDKVHMNKKDIELINYGTN